MNKIIMSAICVSGILASNCFAVADKDGPKIGDVPPELTLTRTIQGPPAAELSWEKLKGKVVVLEFWATWCGPCVQAIPHVNDLVEQFKGKPVVFISVSSESDEVVQNFLKTHPSKCAVGIDDYEALNKAFHVQGIPHAVIVDATGHIVAIVHPARIQPENLEEVLAGKKCSLPEPEVYTVDKHSSDVVPNEAPALYEISIREHKMPAKIQGPICMWSHDTNDFEGKIATVESALGVVWDKNRDRMVIHGKLPEGYYDFELRAAPGHVSDVREQFIGALRTTFHLDVRTAQREVPVYILTQINTNAPGLRTVEKRGGGGGMRAGFRFKGTSLKTVADSLESAVGRPVLNETGLDGIYDVDMKWKLSEAEQLEANVDRRVWEAIDKNPNGDWISDLPPELREGPALEKAKSLKAELAKPEAEQFRPDPDLVIAAARERLGLQLTPARRSVEILEVSEVPKE